jgi:hypothetical protein
MESTVDLTLVAKESQKEEADEKEKERKMAVKLDQLEGIATPMETDTAEDENVSFQIFFNSDIFSVLELFFFI